MSSLRQAVLAVLAVGVLGACSQTNDRTALTQTCVDRGESLEACACITGIMEEKLSPHLFKRTVQVVAREKRDIQEFIESLSDEGQSDYDVVLDDMFSCKLAPPVEETPNN